MVVKSNLLKFKEIEADLRVFFRLFEDYCAFCFKESVRLLQSGKRPDPELFCCCLVDNQVRDYWNILNEVQCRMNGPGWAKKLGKFHLELHRRRLPDNGPCGALSEKGCVLANLRPPTCSTQLCAGMVKILKKLEIVGSLAEIPCQIEEILGVSSPTDILFGLKRGECSHWQIQAFRERLRELIVRLKAVPQDVRLAAIQSAEEELTIKLESRGR